MATDRVSQVLVVEDNPAESQWLCHCLRDHGFHVFGCNSADEALGHIQKRDFGVAVVDLCLPDLSGTQLLARIRSLDDRVRVIIYTGAASADSLSVDVDRCRNFTGGRSLRMGRIRDFPSRRACGQSANSELARAHFAASFGGVC